MSVKTREPFNTILKYCGNDYLKVLVIPVCLDEYISNAGGELAFISILKIGSVICARILITHHI
jgi:hypothetical protein